MLHCSLVERFLLILVSELLLLLLLPLLQFIVLFISGRICCNHDDVPKKVIGVVVFLGPLIYDSSMLKTRESELTIVILY